MNKHRSFKEEMKKILKETLVIAVISIIGLVGLMLYANIVHADNLNDGLYHVETLNGNLTDPISQLNGNVNGFAYQVPGCVGNTNCYIFNASTMSSINFSQTAWNHTGLSSTNYTYSFWVKLNSTIPSDTVILQFDYFNCRIYTNQSLACDDYDGVDNPRVLGAGIISFTNFTNVIVSYNKTNISITMNGVTTNGGKLIPPLSSNVAYHAIGSDIANSRKIGLFMDELYVWNRTLSASEKNNLSLGLTSTQSLYPFTQLGVIPTTPVWVNQTPTNITNLNLYSQNLVVTYNFVDPNNKNQSPYLNFTLLNATSYINGTAVNPILTQNYTSNTTINSTVAYYSFNVSDDVYPGDYNVNPSVMENTPHDTYSSSGASSMIKITLFNVSSSKANNIFEVMGNVNTSGVATVTYCNSSYTSGNPSSSSYCTAFATISSTGYTEGKGNSKHNIVSMTLVNGSLNNVVITSISQFILSRSAGTVNVGYINGSVSTNNTMTTGNTGNAWTDQPWTGDLHIHQFNGTEVLLYNACELNTSNATICSSSIAQGVGLSALPPSAPIVSLNTTNTRYGDVLNVSWTNSTPSNSSTTILGYNITLIYPNLTYLFTINNSILALSTFLNITNMSIGQYFIQVTAMDSLNQSSFSLSPLFTVSNLLKTPCNVTIVQNSSGANTLFSYTTDSASASSNLTLYTGFLEYNFNIFNSGTYNLKGLPQGSYNPSITTYYISGSTTQNMTSCTMNVCQSIWVQRFEPCISNAQLVMYDDIDMCSIAYDAPLNNGTYVQCVTPPNTDKPLWIFIGLLVLFLVLLILGMIYPIAIIGTLIVSVFVSWQYLIYFTDSPVIYALIFPIVTIIVGGLTLVFNRDRS